MIRLFERQTGAYLLLSVVLALSILALGWMALERRGGLELLLDGGGSYVSDSPDLCVNASQQDVSYVSGRFDEYLKHLGVKKESVQDLRLGARLHRSLGLMARFKLAGMEQEKMAGLRPMRVSAADLLTSCTGVEPEKLPGLDAGQRDEVRDFQEA
jgi:hypothetical protein